MGGMGGERSVCNINEEVSEMFRRGWHMCRYPYSLQPSENTVASYIVKNTTFHMGNNKVSWF